MEHDKDLNRASSSSEQESNSVLGTQRPASIQQRLVFFCSISI